MIGVIILSLGMAAIIMIIYEIKSLIKYVGLIIKFKKEKDVFETKLDYFREIPDEKASPAEAVFVKESGHGPEFGDFSKVFSASILSLAEKDYYDIRVKDDGDKDLDGMVYLVFTPKFDKVREARKYHINEKQPDLSDDENLLLEYILNVAEDRDKLFVNNLKAYACENEDNKNELLDLIENMQIKAQVSQKLKGNVNSKGEMQIKKINEEIALNLGVIGLIFAINSVYNQFVGYYVVIMYAVRTNIYDVAGNKYCTFTFYEKKSSLLKSKRNG